MFRKKQKAEDPLASFRKLRRPSEESSSKTVALHEKEVSEGLGGSAHIGSGRIPGKKSDGSTEDYQIECKQTAKESLSLKLSWLQKISSEAYLRGRVPILSIRFLNSEDKLTPKDWILVPYDEFKRFKQL